MTRTVTAIVIGFALLLVIGGLSYSCYLPPYGPELQEPQLHCPICLETEMEQQGEAEISGSPLLDQAWNRNGTEIDTSNISATGRQRRITTKYQCVRGHNFEEICRYPRNAANQDICFIRLSKDTP